MERAPTSPALDRAAAGTSLRAPARSGLSGDFLPGPSSAYARRPFGNDVRAGPRAGVSCLDQDPPALSCASQREASGQLAAAEGEGQAAGFIAGDLGESLVPDDHRAAAPQLPVVPPLEPTGPQLMILDGDGQAPHSGIERRPLRDGPGAQHLAGLDTQVEVERRRVVQLHDEPHDRHEPTVAPGWRHTCGRSPGEGSSPPVDDALPLAQEARNRSQLPETARCRQQTAEASAMNKVITTCTRRQSAGTAAMRVSR